MGAKNYTCEPHSTLATQDVNSFTHGKKFLEVQKTNNIFRANEYEFIKYKLNNIKCFTLTTQHFSTVLLYSFSLHVINRVKLRKVWRHGVRTQCYIKNLSHELYPQYIEANIFGCKSLLFVGRKWKWILIRKKNVFI